MAEVGKRIKQYMAERMGMNQAEVITLRDQYLRQYGTTMRGLILHHEVDQLEYLEFVHDIDLGQYIRPNPRLADTLSRLHTRNVVFTNATAKHAWRVLEAVGVAQSFSRVIDVCDVDFVGKPDPSAYRKALQILGAEAPECALLEDLPRNLLPAAEMGMVTVLVGRPIVPGIDYAICEVADIGCVVDRLNGRVPDDGP